MKISARAILRESGQVRKHFGRGRAIALDEANRSGPYQTWRLCIDVVFGGGLTWASTIIEW